MANGVRFAEHSPFGTPNSIFCVNPLAQNFSRNEGLGSGGLEPGFRNNTIGKPFNPQVLMVRSGASSMAGERRADDELYLRGPLRRSAAEQLKV
jgi:hypothetical protein